MLGSKNMSKSFLWRCVYSRLSPAYWPYSISVAAIVRWRLLQPLVHPMGRDISVLCADSEVTEYEMLLVREAQLRGRLSEAPLQH